MKSPTSKYWNAYINAVEILSDLCAEKVGDWKHHYILWCQAKMLPYMFAVNIHNYSR